MIFISTQRNLNFDKETPSGYTLQKQINQQQQHSTLTPIHINMNKIYMAADEPNNVVNYIIEQGI